MNKLVKLLAVPALLSVGMMSHANTQDMSFENIDFDAIEAAVNQCDSKIMGKKGKVINGKTYHKYRDAIDAAEQAKDKKAIKMLDDALDKCMIEAGF